MRAKEFVLEQDASAKTRDDILYQMQQDLDLDTDYIPDTLPITAPGEGDSVVAFTTPKKQRDILKNPEEYQWGTKIKKDSDYHRPLLRNPELLQPRGRSDFTKPPGMELGKPPAPVPDDDLTNI